MITREPEENGRQQEQEILNLVEAAKYLGVSTKTFQKVLREGEIPGRKVGREWKFSREALRDWIGAGKSRDFLEIEPREEVQESLLAARPFTPRAVPRKELSGQEG